jgi:hypothetical protein
MTDQDLFYVKMGDEKVNEQSLPLEIRNQLEKIERINPYEFVDGIDTENHSYIYQNAFNQFRYENEVSKHQNKF